MPPIRMDIILYAQTGCAITSCTKINDGINFELNTQNFLLPIVTGGWKVRVGFLLQTELTKLPVSALSKSTVTQTEFESKPNEQSTNVNQTQSQNISFLFERVD